MKSRVRNATLVMTVFFLMMVPIAHGKTSITVGLPGESSVHSPLILQRFKENHPDIHVEVVSMPWESFFDKLILMLVTDTAPDVWYGEAGRAMQWYDSGFTLDVKPLAHRDLDLDDYFFLHAAEVPSSGAWTGIPSDFQVTSLFYNTEHFQRGGLPYPDDRWTSDDLLMTARKLTLPGVEGAERWGFVLQPEYITAGWMLWTKLLGGNILDASREHSRLNEPDTIDALNDMAAFMHIYGIAPPPGVIGFSPGDAVEMFRRGQSSMMFNIYTWNRYLQEGDMHTYDVEVVPASPTGERITTAVPNVWVINKRAPSKQQEAAWDWIRFQIGEEAQKIRMAAGSGVPVNRQLAWDFADLPSPPSNRRIYLDSYAFANTLEENAVWDQYVTAIEKELQPLWAAEKTAQDVANEAHRRVEEILSKAT